MRKKCIVILLSALIVAWDFGAIPVLAEDNSIEAETENVVYESNSTGFESTTVVESNEETIQGATKEIDEKTDTLTDLQENQEDQHNDFIDEPENSSSQDNESSMQYEEEKKNDMLNIAINIISILSFLVSVVSLVVGIIAMNNTSLIKKEQAREIEAAQEIAIFNSNMPRAAILEKPNHAGMGIVFLQVENYDTLVDYLREHPDEKVVTSKYGGNGPYNKVEVEKRYLCNDR